ncbi:hypothetical protein TNCV_1249091 [Trichonephila clavipes]|nr:hypothetical protein TNCV_1249091 [Trichonephila clavipes]
MHFKQKGYLQQQNFFMVSLGWKGKKQHSTAKESGYSPFTVIPHLRRDGKPSQVTLAVAQISAHGKKKMQPQR